VHYQTPAREFALSRIELDGSAAFEAHVSGPELLLCTEGSVELTAPGATSTTLVLRRGAGCFVPAAQGSFVATGAGRLFRATVPRGAE
jgi:mannose-6-phosphate isomerase